MILKLENIKGSKDEIEKMAWNKLKIVRSRELMIIKNKVLPCDLVIFQTPWCYYLEFILNIRILSILILAHFKPTFHFYTPIKHQQILGFQCFMGLEMV